MRHRTTLLLLLLFFAGLGGLWWAEYRGLPTARQRREVLGRIFPALSRTPPAAVRAVEVERADGSSIVVRRAPGVGWQIAKPIDALADPDLVETLVRNVLGLRASPDAGTIEGNPADYGLATPSATVRLIGDDAARPLAVLRLGTTSGKRLFVRGEGEGSGTIEVVDSKLLAAVERPAAGWRDTNLLRMPTFRVAGLTVDQSEPAATVELARDAGRWRMSRPLKTLADGDRVEGLIAELSALHAADDASGFVADGVTDLAPYGLDRPAYTFTLVPFRDAGPPQAVRIGKEVPDHPGQRYAVRDGQDEVVRVDVKMLLDRYQGPTSLRDRHVADIDPKAVRRIVVESGGLVFDLTRTSRGWRRLKPVESNADALVIEKLLSALAAAEASEFLDPLSVPEPRLYPPETRIQVWQLGDGMAPGASSAAASAFSETPRLDLRLGRYDPIRKTIYGQLAGDSKIVALPESLYEAIPRGEFAFRDLTVLSFNPAQIDRLIVDRPGRSVTLQAPGSGTRATSWRMVAPVDTPADETAVTTLLVALSSLRAESWESESIANPAAYGFDRPSLRIRWMPRSGGTSGTPDASLSQTLRIGRAKPKSRAFYANIEGQSTVFALGPAEVIALDAELRDRRVLRYEPDRVRRVLLEWPGRTIALEPLAAEATGGRRTWRAEGVYEPGGFDPTPIGELVDSLAKLQTNRYLQHEGPISPFFGFDPPRLTITLTLADDATPRVLRVGTPLTTAQSAATTGDGRNGAVFVLPTTETWDRLIREPGRPGGLPDDVFVPIPEPVAP